MTAGGLPRRRLWPAVVAVAAIAVTVAAAWVLQNRADGAAGSKDPAAPAYSIKVERDGEVLRQYDLAALHALPQSHVVIDGKEQTGPLLATLLKDAGATPYRRVEVRGAGLRDDGRLTLTASQVAGRVVVDFSERGTAKVCGPELYRMEWVRDVVAIDVE